MAAQNPIDENPKSQRDLRIVAENSRLTSENENLQDTLAKSNDKLDDMNFRSWVRAGMAGALGFVFGALAAAVTFDNNEAEAIAEEPTPIEIIEP